MTRRHHPPVRLGAAYYPEYLPADRRPGAPERDLDLMAQAGISVIRVGESVWSSWEPSDGVFDLEWMTPILDAAHARGIGVLLGTPTYAVPPWLQRKHPEIAVVRKDGSRAAWGARQEADFTNPVFLRYAERVIRAILARHGMHDAVIGLQLDNEPGLHLIHNPGTVTRFVAWLREQYGSVDELNEAWGLTYWSHRIGDWNELWEPGGNTTPAYDLAWRRFQADETTRFLQWQTEIARDHVPEDRFLTTCIAYNRPAVDDVALGEVLDIVSGNAYFTFQDELHAEAGSRFGAGVWYSTSPAALLAQADRMWSSRQGRFLVTETGATSIAGSSFNFPPFPGQLEQAAFALIARGAGMVGYWHWHTLHSGAETYWGGILGHDLEPGRTYDAVERLGAKLRVAGDALAGLQPHTDVGVLFSRESRWAMQFQPPLATAGGEPDPASYDRILGRFAEAAFSAKLQCGYVSVEQLRFDGEDGGPGPAREPGIAEEAGSGRATLSATDLLARFPTLVVAGAVCLGDGAAAVLAEYARIGGRLIVGIRSGYGDELGRARAETAPGPLRAVCGVRYREYSNLRVPVGLTARDHSELPDAGHAEAWIDYLECEGAQPLLHYADERFAEWPAVTEHAVGFGSVVTIGTLPDRHTLGRILGRSSGAADAAFPGLPPEVTAHSARNATGSTVWFLHNWSGQPRMATADRALLDLLDPDRADAGADLELPAWGVRVFQERSDQRAGPDARPRPSDGGTAT